MDRIDNDENGESYAEQYLNARENLINSIKEGEKEYINEANDYSRFRVIDSLEYQRNKVDHFLELAKQQANGEEVSFVLRPELYKPLSGD